MTRRPTGADRPHEARMPEVRLCGTTTVVTATGALTGDALGGPRARRLLGRLALTDGAPAREHDLVADLGPLDRLRADAAALAEALAEPGLIVADESGWRLPPGWAVVDHAVARRLLDRAARTGPSTTLALTLRALRSCRGTLLASEGRADWAVRAREAHEAALRDALVRAAAAATALHDHELARDLLARVPGARSVAATAHPTGHGAGGSGGGDGGLLLRSAIPVTPTATSRTLVPWRTSRVRRGRTWSGWSSSTTTAPSPTSSPAR